MPQLDFNNSLYLAYFQFLTINLFIIWDIKREEQFIFMEHLLLVNVIEMYIDFVTFGAARAQESRNVWSVLVE